MGIERRLKKIENELHEGRQKIVCKDGSSFWVGAEEAVAACAEGIKFAAGMFDGKDELSEDTLRFLDAEEGQSSLADYVKMLIKNREDENVWNGEDKNVN